MCTNKECNNPVSNGCGNWRPPEYLTREEFDKNLNALRAMYLNPTSVKWDGEGECPFCDLASSGAYEEVIFELCVEINRLIDCPLCNNDFGMEYGE